MPGLADLLSSQIPDPDPSDALRDPLGQGQNLAGLSPQPGQGAAPPPQMPPGIGAPGMPPSPNVPGPLTALTQPGLARAAGKPRIKLKLTPTMAKKIKPRIKLKASAYGGTI